MNGHSIEPAPQPGARLPRWFASVRPADPPDPADPPTAPTGRQIIADIALATAATAVALVLAVLVARHPLAAGPGPSPAAAGGAEWLAFLPAVAARMAPLTIRRLRPLTAFWLCLAVCVLFAYPESLRGAAGANAVDLIALALAAYSAVVHSPHQSAALLSTPAGVIIVVFHGIAPEPSDDYTLSGTLLVLMAVLVAGYVVRRRASESQARLLRLREEQENATRQAIGRERARIASELHDVVTHNVSMMVVQAGAARRVLGASPEEVRSALLAIEESGRDAIVELQHMLGLLAPPSEPEDTGTGEPLRPQPGLDQIRPLLDRVTAAGLPTELRIRGTPRTLPPGMDLAAYRVVQECLTNVIKHAGRSSATVTLDYQHDALLIEVADDGGPGGAGPSLLAASATLGSGRGLLGLRERVLMYGGELEAGCPSGGGWRVRARLPRPPASATIPVLP